MTTPKETPETDPDITRRMASELEAIGPFEVVFAPLTVVQLAGLLQLALRHPGVRSMDVSASADRFLAGARAYFATCPTVLDMLNRGDDPTQDART